MEGDESLGAWVILEPDPALGAEQTQPSMPGSPKGLALLGACPHP